MAKQKPHPTGAGSLHHIVQDSRHQKRGIILIRAIDKGVPASVIPGRFYMNENKHAVRAQGPCAVIHDNVATRGEKPHGFGLAGIENRF